MKFTFREKIGKFSYLYCELFCGISQIVANMNEAKNANTMLNFCSRKFKIQNSVFPRTFIKIQHAMSQPVTWKNLSNGLYFSRNFRVFCITSAFFRKIITFFHNMFALFFSHFFSRSLHSLFGGNLGFLQTREQNDLCLLEFILWKG